MPHLTAHELRQMDRQWLAQQPETVVRSLAALLLEDLLELHDRLNQSPTNSSRPPSSRAPWERARPAAREAVGDDAANRTHSPPASPRRERTDVEADAAGCSTASGESATPSRSTNAQDHPPTPPPVPPQATPEATPARPGRRQGAPGHVRQQQLTPARTEEHRPTGCPACRRELPSDGPARAWSGWDTLEMLPLGDPRDAGAPALGLRIEVTRHRLMEQRCPCGHLTRCRPHQAAKDDLWQGVNIGERRLLGPRLAAALVMLNLRLRLSRRQAAELMLEWFGLQLSPALISQTVHQAARSVAPMEAELARHIEHAVLVHGDETPWPEAARSLWLGVLVSCSTVLYFIGARTKAMLDNALSTTFAGTLVAEGYGAYRVRINRLRCWAHLVRKLRGLAESTDRHAAQVGAEMLAIANTLITAVMDARQYWAQAPPELDQHPPAKTHAELIAQLRQLCQTHRDARHKLLRSIAREFLNDWQVIVKQLDHPTLPLTNNVAERQLRHHVIARRISLGTRTPVGTHAVALLCSVIDTCRLRRASASAFLASAIQAARTGNTLPSLPPIPHDLSPSRLLRCLPGCHLPTTAPRY